MNPLRDRYTGTVNVTLDSLSGEFLEMLNKADTSSFVTIGGLTVTIDPLKHKRIIYQGRDVGYIKDTRQEGESYIADIVLTDPEILKLIHK